MDYFLAIDVGGTKIAVAIFNKGVLIGNLTSKSETETAQTMYDALMRTVNELLTTTNVKKESLHTIGLIIPGQIDFEKEIAVYQNNLPWENFQIGRKMRHAFPKAKFILKSDVRAAAIGEWIAKGRPDGMFLYVTISTGLSASIIYRGNVIEGSGFAGEIGYMQDERERVLEKVVSGSAMERELRSEFHYGSLKEAFDAFHRSDREMIRYFSKKAAIIARCLYNIFTIIDPEYLVLGGGVIYKQSEFYHLIIKHFEGMAQHPGQVGRIDRIFKSTYKEMAGIYGLLGEV